MGLDGKPRDLHIAESMASIDFDDFEPGMDEPNGRNLASCEYFTVDELDLKAGDPIANQNDRFSIITVVSGEITYRGTLTFREGDFFILPRGAGQLSAIGTAKVLQTMIP